MPRSKLLPKPLPTDGDSFGQRLARLRKERGFTQVELADKVGIIQVLVSDYERNRLRPHADIIVRFSLALGVSADELLGLHVPKDKSTKPKKSRRFLRRLELVDSLPKRDQDALLRTIDAFLERAKAS